MADPRLGVEFVHRPVCEACGTRWPCKKHPTAPADPMAIADLLACLRFADARFQTLEADLLRLHRWLEKIEAAETRYSLDPLQHAHWCIEELRQMARDALAGSKGEVDGG